MSGSSNKVVLIIPGEASSDLMFDWARSGTLPNISKLMQRGASGVIHSPEPFVSAQLWGTMLSGYNAGRHGLFDFMQRSAKGAFRETCRGDLKVPAIWDLVENSGLKAAVVNVPYTYPPSQLSGFMISGQDAPGAHRSIAEPKELFDHIVRKFGEYPVKKIFPGGRKKSDYLTLVDEECDQWVSIVEELAAAKDWDLLVFYTGATAMTQHYFWSDMTDVDPSNPYKNVIQSAFIGLDKIVGKLVEVAGTDTNYFIVSESGAGPLQAGVDVNAYLAKNGYLAFKDTQAGATNRSSFARLRFAAQSRLPDRLKTHILRFIRPLKSWIINQFDGGDIDWSKTLAYTRGEEGQIFINLKGRDPHGVVNPGAEFDSLRSSIKENVLQLKDPETNEFAVTSVEYSEDVYSGEFTHLAPDLVVQWRDGKYMPNENTERSDDIFGVRWREGMDWPTTGSHRANATFIAAGPRVMKNSTLQDAKLIDLTPTLLKCFDIQPASEMEGRVLTEIMS